MSGLFLFLFFLSFFILIIGLIKPSIFRKVLGFVPSRKIIALVCLWAMTFFLIASRVTVPKTPQKEKEMLQKEEEIVVNQNLAPKEKTETVSKEKEEEEAPPTLPVQSPAPTPPSSQPPSGGQTSAVQPSQEVQPPVAEEPTEYKVTYVVDGDTIEIEGDKRVRLIGINTPESGQPYFSEARNKLIELVLNKRVRLEKDVSDKDQYGRLLRYVYVGDLFVNLEMVRLGYANSYSYPPDIKYQDQLLAAEREAREKQIGLWAPAQELTGTIVVSQMRADAAGDDNKNLNDEYFVLKNTSTKPINLTGWTVKDAATHIYTFPSFILGGNASVTIFTGSGSNTAVELYWGSTRAIWNNDGDTLYLRDKNGNLVLEYTY